MNHPKPVLLEPEINPNLPDHARYSPSGFSRGLQCRGHIAMYKFAPPEAFENTPESEEGTAAHEVAEQSLKTHCAPTRFIGRTYSKGYECTPEMANHLMLYYHVCSKLRASAKAYAVEWKVMVESIHEEMFGTMDFASLSHDAVLDIVDLKFGRVAVNRHTQLVVYAIGAILYLHRLYGPDCVKLVRTTVIQPRDNHPDGPVRTMIHDVEDLLANVEGYALAAHEVLELADDPQFTEPAMLMPHLTTGPDCQYCRARTFCPKLVNAVQKMVDGDATAEQVAQINEPLPTPTETQTAHPATLTAEQLQWVLLMANPIQKFLYAVKDRVKALHDKGEPVPMTKVVRKRTKAKWRDDFTPAKALAKLEKRGYVIQDITKEPELLSISDMQKALGNDFQIISEYVTRESGELEAVHESDSRRPVNAPGGGGAAAAASDFGEFDG